MKSKIVVLSLCALTLYVASNCISKETQEPGHNTRNKIAKRTLGKTLDLSKMVSAGDPNLLNVFNDIINDGPVIVKFEASWCPPCKRMAPILEDLAQEFENILILKVDVDTFSSLAQKYNIKSLPTILMFNKGKKVSQHSFMDKKEMRKEIKRSYNIS